MDTVFVHYGSSKYDAEKFNPIKNTPLFTKPEGGLWGSLENAVYGWKEWCKTQDYHTENLEEHFRFTLSPPASILKISNKQDLTELPKAEPMAVNGKEIPISFTPWVHIDFEKLLAEGVDAVQVSISDDTATSFDDSVLNVEATQWIITFKKVLLLPKICEMKQSNMEST